MEQRREGSVAGTNGSDFGRVRRSSLLGMGKQDLISMASTAKDRVLQDLAWIILHYIPWVVENRTGLYQALLSKAPLHRLVTPSDLAFVVLVLEHNILAWRHQILHNWETDGTDPGFTAPNSLLYSCGIEGADATDRYKTLCAYFHRNFYCPSHPAKQANMGRLLTLLRNLISPRATRNSLEARLVSLETAQSNKKSDSPTGEPTLREVQDDILHRLYDRVDF